MYSKHFNALQQRYSHYLPLGLPYIALAPIISKHIAFLTKQCPFTCILHSYPIYRHTDRHMDKPPNIIIALEFLHHSTKLQSYNPSQSKVILTHVNSTNYPVNGLKCILTLCHFGYHKYTPSHICP